MGGFRDRSGDGDKAAQETLALLELLAIGQAEITAGEVRSVAGLADRIIGNAMDDLC